jgi:hypothetical protein
MIKITRKLINEIIKLNNPTDEDLNVLKRFIEPGLLKSIIIKEDKLLLKALKKYNEISEAGRD